MKESAKWRGGRDADRVGRSLPSGRGGEMLHAFGDHEREAAEHDGHMMMPADERPALKMVQS